MSGVTHPAGIIPDVLKLCLLIFSTQISLTAGEYCYSYERGGSTYCSKDCCYSGGNYHCCDKTNVPAIAGSVTGIVVAVVIVFVICCCCCRRRREHAGTVVSTTPQQQVTVFSVPQGPQGVMMAPQPGAYPNGLATPAINQQQAFPQQLAPGPNLQPPPYQPQTAPLAGPPSATAQGSNPVLSSAPVNTQPPPYQPQATPQRHQSDDSYIHPVSAGAVQNPPTSGGYINAGMNDEPDWRRNRPVGQVSVSPVNDGYEEPSSSVHVYEEPDPIGYEEPVAPRYEQAMPRRSDHMYEELNFDRDT